MEAIRIPSAEEQPKVQIEEIRYSTLPEPAQIFLWVTACEQAKVRVGSCSFLQNLKAEASFGWICV